MSVTVNKQWTVRLLESEEARVAMDQFIQFNWSTTTPTDYTTRPWFKYVDPTKHGRFYEWPEFTMDMDIALSECAFFFESSLPLMPWWKKRSHDIEAAEEALHPQTYVFQVARLCRCLHICAGLLRGFAFGLGSYYNAKQSNVTLRRLVQGLHNPMSTILRGHYTALVIASLMRVHAKFNQFIELYNDVAQEVMDAVPDMKEDLASPLEVYMTSVHPLHARRILKELIQTELMGIIENKPSPMYAMFQQRDVSLAMVLARTRQELSTPQPIQSIDASGDKTSKPLPFSPPVFVDMYPAGTGAIQSTATAAGRRKPATAGKQDNEQVTKRQKATSDTRERVDQSNASIEDESDVLMATTEVKQRFTRFPVGLVVDSLSGNRYVVSKTVAAGRSLMHTVRSIKFNNFVAECPTMKRACIAIQKKDNVSLEDAWAKTLQSTLVTKETTMYLLENAGKKHAKCRKCMELDSDVEIVQKRAYQEAYEAYRQKLQENPTKVDLKSESDTDIPVRLEDSKTRLSESNDAGRSLGLLMNIPQSDASFSSSSSDSSQRLEQSQRSKAMLEWAFNNPERSATYIHPAASEFKRPPPLSPLLVDNPINALHPQGEFAVGDSNEPESPPEEEQHTPSLMTRVGKVVKSGIPIIIALGVAGVAAYAMHNRLNTHEAQTPFRNFKSAPARNPFVSDVSEAPTVETVETLARRMNASEPIPTPLVERPVDEFTKLFFSAASQSPSPVQSQPVQPAQPAPPSLPEPIPPFVEVPILPETTHVPAELPVRSYTNAFQQRQERQFESELNPIWRKMLYPDAPNPVYITSTPQEPPRPPVQIVQTPVQQPVVVNKPVQPATVKTVQPATVKTVQPATVKTVQPAVKTIQPATVKTVQPATVTTVQPKTVQPATVKTIQPTIKTVQPATVTTIKTVKPTTLAIAPPPVKPAIGPPKPVVVKTTTVTQPVTVVKPLVVVSPPVPLAIAPPPAPSDPIPITPSTARGTWNNPYAVQVIQQTSTHQPPRRDLLGMAATVAPELVCPGMRNITLGGFLNNISVLATGAVMAPMQLNATVAHMSELSTRTSNGPLTVDTVLQYTQVVETLNATRSIVSNDVPQNASASDLLNLTQTMTNVNASISDRLATVSTAIGVGSIAVDASRTFSTGTISMATVMNVCLMLHRTWTRSRWGRQQPDQLVENDVKNATERAADALAMSPFPGAPSASLLSGAGRQMTRVVTTMNKIGNGLSSIVAVFKEFLVEFMESFSLLGIPASLQFLTNFLLSNTWSLLENATTLVGLFATGALDLWQLAVRGPLQTRDLGMFAARVIVCLSMHLANHLQWFPEFFNPTLVLSLCVAMFRTYRRIMKRKQDREARESVEGANIYYAATHGQHPTESGASGPKLSTPIVVTPASLLVTPSPTLVTPLPTGVTPNPAPVLVPSTPILVTPPAILIEPTPIVTPTVDVVEETDPLWTPEEEEEEKKFIMEMNNAGPRLLERKHRVCTLDKDTLEEISHVFTVWLGRYAPHMDYSQRPSHWTNPTAANVEHMIRLLNKSTIMTSSADPTEEQIRFAASLFQSQLSSKNPFQAQEWIRDNQIISESYWALRGTYATEDDDSKKTASTGDSKAKGVVSRGGRRAREIAYFSTWATLKLSSIIGIPRRLRLNADVYTWERFRTNQEQSIRSIVNSRFFAGDGQESLEPLIAWCDAYINRPVGTLVPMMVFPFLQDMDPGRVMPADTSDVKRPEVTIWKQALYPLQTPDESNSGAYRLDPYTTQANAFHLFTLAMHRLSFATLDATKELFNELANSGLDPNLTDYKHAQLFVQSCLDLTWDSNKNVGIVPDAVWDGASPPSKVIEPWDPDDPGHTGRHPWLQIHPNSTLLERVTPQFEWLKSLHMKLKYMTYTDQLHEQLLTPGYNQVTRESYDCAIRSLIHFAHHYSSHINHLDMPTSSSIRRYLLAPDMSVHCDTNEMFLQPLAHPVGFDLASHNCKSFVPSMLASAWPDAPPPESSRGLLSFAGALNPTDLVRIIRRAKLWKYRFGFSDRLMQLVKDYRNNTRDLSNPDKVVAYTQTYMRKDRIQPIIDSIKSNDGSPARVPMFALASRNASQISKVVLEAEQLDPTLYTPPALEDAEHMEPQRLLQGVDEALTTAELFNEDQLRLDFVLYPLPHEEELETCWFDMYYRYDQLDEKDPLEMVKWTRDVCVFMTQIKFHQTVRESSTRPITCHPAWVLLGREDSSWENLVSETVRETVSTSESIQSDHLPLCLVPHHMEELFRGHKSDRILSRWPMFLLGQSVPVLYTRKDATVYDLCVRLYNWNYPDLILDNLIVCFLVHFSFGDWLREYATTNNLPIEDVKARLTRTIGAALVKEVLDHRKQNQYERPTEPEYWNVLSADRCRDIALSTMATFFANSASYVGTRESRDVQLLVQVLVRGVEGLASG